MIALMEDLDRWSCDNSDFVVGELLPELKLSEPVKQMVRWSYGEDQTCRLFDHSAASYEILSDGETLVEDWFLDGIIKNPAGVTHDYGNRVPFHRTPDGHGWTAWELNCMYRQIQKALWDWDTKRKSKDLNALTRTLRAIKGFRLRWRRWLGVTISIPSWYKRSKKKNRLQKA